MGDFGVPFEMEFLGICDPITTPIRRMACAVVERGVLDLVPGTELRHYEDALEWFLDDSREMHSCLWWGDLGGCIPIVEKIRKVLLAGGGILDVVKNPAGLRRKGPNTKIMRALEERKRLRRNGK